MAKRITKANRILNDARARVEAAKSELARCQRAATSANTDVSVAAAELRAHVAAYEALEAELTPKPRKAKEKPATDANAQKESATDKDSKGPICGVCGNAKDYQDHFQPSPNYHPFEPPKPVVRAKKNSKSNSHESKISTSAQV